MDENLDTPKALSMLFNFIKEANKLIDAKKISQRNAGEIVKALFEIDSVLGLLGMRKTGIRISGLEEKVARVLKKFSPNYELKEMDLETLMRAALALREQFRHGKDFEDADAIRRELLNIGIKVEDTEEGPKWRLVK